MPQCTLLHWTGLTYLGTCRDLSPGGRCWRAGREDLRRDSYPGTHGHHWLEDHTVCTSAQQEVGLLIRRSDGIVAYRCRYVVNDDQHGVDEVEGAAFSPPPPARSTRTFWDDVATLLPCTPPRRPDAGRRLPKRDHDPASVPWAAPTSPPRR